MPYLLGDSVHVNRQANPAVTDECKAQFFFAHNHIVACRTGEGKCALSLAMLVEDFIRHNRGRHGCVQAVGAPAHWHFHK